MNQDLTVFFQKLVYLKAISLNTIPLKKVKDRAYIINLDEYANVGLLYFVKKK